MTYAGKLSVDTAAKGRNAYVGRKCDGAWKLGGSSKEVKFWIKTTTVFINLYQNSVVLKILPPVTFRVRTQRLSKIYK